jgi:hypothetical protein
MPGSQIHANANARCEHGSKTGIFIKYNSMSRNLSHPIALALNDGGSTIFMLSVQNDTARISLKDPLLHDAIRMTSAIHKSTTLILAAGGVLFPDDQALHDRA